MYIYFTMIAASVLCSFIAVRRCSTEEINGALVRRYSRFTAKLCVALSVCIPLLISGLRYNVGTDYSGTYTADYILIKNGLRTREEFFSYLIYRISQLLSGNIQFFFFITSAMFCVFSFLCIYRYSADPVFSVLLFYITYTFFTSMNAVRQYIAIAFIYCFIGLLEQKKYIKFLIVVLCAMLFHYSVIVFLILIPMDMASKNISRSIIICLVFFIAALLFINTPLFSNIASYFGYSNYLTYKYNFGVSSTNIYMDIAILAAAAVLGAREYACGGRYRTLVNIQLLSVLFCFLDGFLPMVGRFLYSFHYGYILLVPMIAGNIKSSRLKKAAYIVIISGYSVWMIHGLSKNWDNVLPYNFNPNGIF